MALRFGQTGTPLLTESATSPEEDGPFWDYVDLGVAVGIWLAAPLASSVLLGAILSGLHIPMTSEPGAGAVLANQVIFYALVFGSVAAWLIMRHDHPVWSSLGWTKMSLPPSRVILLGLLSSCAVVVLALLIRVPSAPNEMSKLIANRTSLLFIGVFAMTVGPVCEELAFRGFLQPLLVGSLGPAVGVVAAAIPFGLVHLAEYGYSWRHALLVIAAGSAFGWMRHRTGSTKAATLMHSSYNAVVLIIAMVGVQPRPE